MKTAKVGTLSTATYRRQGTEACVLLLKQAIERAVVWGGRAAAMRCYALRRSVAYPCSDTLTIRSTVYQIMTAKRSTMCVGVGGSLLDLRVPPQAAITFALQ